MEAKHRLPWLIALCTSLVFVGGCAAGPTPNGTTSAPRTLTVVHVDGDAGFEPATKWFAEALARRSGGALTVQFRFACCGRGADVEQQLIRQVAGGEADLGWVGVRAFHDAGVDALDPLIQPLLLTNYPAQRAALEAAESQAALSALEPLGVTGIGLVPGSLRYPMSTGRPLHDPKSWRGLHFYTFASSVAREAIGTLGASVLELGFDERDARLASGGIDALDNSLLYQADRTDVLPYTVVNLPLWARVSALIAAPRLALTDEQRGWLAAAARDAVGRTEELAAIDAGAVLGGCRNDARYAVASPQELKRFRTAFESVQPSTANDPLRQRMVRIATDHPAQAPVTCATASASPHGDDGNGVLNGSFTTIDWNEKAQRAHHMPPSVLLPGDGYGRFVFEFADGSFHVRLTDGSCTGSYGVQGNTVTVDLVPGVCGNGRYFTATFAVDDHRLVFTDFDSPNEIDGLDTVLFTSAPLERLS